ncbi:hypothetical protein IF2G_00111 [Cordyceps javanica]|nr:hypothetical protein IF2G_00111 [Cordyceps javanica]
MSLARILDVCIGCIRRELTTPAVRSRRAMPSTGTRMSHPWVQCMWPADWCVNNNNPLLSMLISLLHNGSCDIAWFLLILPCPPHPDGERPSGDTG